MEIIDFNQNWRYGVLGASERTNVSLPHDAMRTELRTNKSKGKEHISWHLGNDYSYEKNFYISNEHKHKEVMFEFEGVYRNAEVFVNGEKLMYRPYGYTNFFVNATSYIKFGEENNIQVFAYNSDQPNSRWYTGSGIYRPVKMILLPKKHVKVNGVKVRTVSLNPARIAINIETNGPGDLDIQIHNESSQLISNKVFTDSSIEVELEIPQAVYWSTDTPYLYKCVVDFEGSKFETEFGIRTINWGSKNGLEINGERVILKGACVHHDNGLLGAAAFEDAEWRKVKLLKDIGYNAIRSAHNPCSKAMLRACDELGMLVLDEYVDMWYIHKTNHDYTDYFDQWWEEDLKDMVDKDYNHPSVIMYSIGNEVSETAEERGINITKELTEYLHKLDSTRPVTCGVNIFFNYLSSLGFGVYSDEKAEKDENRSKPVGSEYYNKLAGILGDKTMKLGATLRGSDLKTKDAFEQLDIAGYNYGILRYKKDLKKYPDRLILGTETFCKDAYSFMELAKENPRIIGDFVWAGWDYLGEAGIGAWVYEDYAPKNADESGWMTAGSGRLDITGKQGGEALYTSVALEKTNGPYIAVKPVFQTGAHSPSAWKMTDAIDSWTWPNCEGMKAQVEVYARAAFVELLINGRVIAKKKTKKDCRVIFKTKYEKGTIEAIAYDDNHKEIGRHHLTTANDETILSVLPESPTVRPGGLSFIRIAFTDSNAVLKPMENHIVKVEVHGGKLLAFGHACPYNPQGYIESETNTYYGEALAIVQAEEKDNSEIQVIFTYGNNKITERKLPIRKGVEC